LTSTDTEAGPSHVDNVGWESGAIGGGVGDLVGLEPTTTTTTPPPPEPEPPAPPAPAPAPAVAPPPPAPAPPPPPPAPPVSCGGGGAVVDAMNRDRAANGLAPLCGNGQLTQAAQNWANWMAQNGSLTHQNLGAFIGSTPFRTAGENILVAPAGT